MIVEIISVGDELITGKVTDTNSSFLASEVTKLGLKSLFKSNIGDDREHIKEALKLALSRANIIIFTGGLGPTEDDLTLGSIASFFGVEMVFDPEIAGHIRGIFDSRGIIMPECNLKQAYIPFGSEILKNPAGTAPGILWDVSTILKTSEKKLILAFPGVPQEMIRMWKDVALPNLSSLSEMHLYEKFINCCGISESALVEMLPAYLHADDPKVRPYANNFQIQLRVFSENKDPKIARNKVENVIKEIYNIAGDYIYGYNDDTLESVVAALLLKHNKTIAIAESCTGGLLSSRLTDISGSSSYIKLNLVTYANEAKTNILGVSADLINQHGAVSPKVADIMAKNIREVAETDIGISVTGIAGPTGGSPEKPVGTVYISIADENNVYSFKRNTSPDFLRTQIKWRFSQFALDLIRKHLLEYKKSVSLDNKAMTAY